VGVRVVLAGFVGVMCRVQVMAVRQMGVMARLFGVGAAVVFRRLAVVLGGGFVMLGGLLVVFSQQACVHDPSSSAAGDVPARG
jgi:hypothetical protein